MKLNPQVSPEWLLCEVIAALSRLVMALAGVAVVLMVGFLLGLLPPLFGDYWGYGARTVVGILLAVGILGLFAPYWSHTTRCRYREMLLDAAALALVALFICSALLVLGWTERPSIGVVGEGFTALMLFLILCEVALTGGILLIWTAVITSRRRRIITSRDPALGW